MNEFNPFDELGITFDDTWLQETRRDRNYKNKYNPFDMNKDINVDLNTEPEYQPDFSQSLTNTNNPKDFQVSQELWITIPEPMSEEEKQAYVDALSEDDWKTWKNLRDEWFSFEARKALFDNRDDLYDITAPWNKKFWSWNKNSFMQWWLDIAQEALDYQEDVIHPWTQTWKEKREENSANYMDTSYWQIYQQLEDERINAEDNWLLKIIKKWRNIHDAFVKNEANLLGWMISQLVADWIDAIDKFGNIATQLFSYVGNEIAWYKWNYNLSLVDPESQTIKWSYRELVKDTLWAWFTVKYPLATYVLTSAMEKIPILEKWWDWSFEWIKAWTKFICETIWLWNMKLDDLTPEELDTFYNDVTLWIMIFIAEKTWMWIKWLEKMDAYKKFMWIRDEVVNFENSWFKKLPEEPNKELMKDFEKEKGTKIKNKKWESFMDKLDNPDLTRFRNELDNLKNKIKTDTETEIGIREEKPAEEVREETPKEEIKTDWTWKKTTSKQISKKVEYSENQTIWEYIKKISNEISWKKWWMDQDLFEKFSSSADLQNEYLNTIDPYIRANGWDNPGWVIENQLNDFVDTVKDQLNDRRNKNIDSRKYQMKYKVQIPEADKIKREQEDIEIKSLIKTLSSTSKDPEKFLNYLLKLPKEKIQAFNKLIPDFSKNLGLIKDTLDLTKAITSKDLLWKFLQYKSTWWTRRKNFIRKYLWRKINEAYMKAWVKRNMYEIEKILNKLSEEQLVELEETMANDNIPAYMKQDFINNLYDKLDSKPIEAVEWKKIGDTTIQLPKKTRDEIIEWELTKQGYRRENDTTPEYKTEEELRQHKLPDWTTVWQWMDWTKAHFSPKLFKDFRSSEADFWNKAINYNRNGFSMSSFLAWHEIAHFVLGKLTTSELFDLTERIRKLTKDSGKEINRVWMWEYLSDTISNFWNHWDIDWLKNLLTKNLEWPKKEITEHIQNLLESFKKDKLFQDRAPRYENPSYQGWVTAWERIDFLRKVDPNFKDYSFDLDVNSPTFSEMRFNMKDWKSLSRDEWKETLSHDQYLKLYSSEDLFNLEKEIKNQSKETSNWRDDIKKEINDAEAYFGKSKYEKYQKAVKNIDPDIIWLTEKDWQIYVKYLMESQRERYELPDRPWYVEVKEVPAKDYFTEEELNQLPKDLVSKIKKDAD